ncbi:MAG TPA: bifunctional 2-polyprenyl-6-hydroxyphenol methylase/3-demethylubiquinol 3-O-methyltransferase UbiG [Hyphomonadaceae bacterium]|nr:bifunctional 2-polyprenyl-6-hydroxyphenol methylase/3-demethylubiquinol 3-O-methyltransferase UbiG [Hyphomonadaceae bacterium]
MSKTLARDETIPASPSVDPDEIEKFRAMAADWWSPTGKFAPLHKFNPVRLTFIRDAAVQHFGLPAESRRPLEGLRLLDAGCGGGLVTEPMARLGAHAVGIDAGDANIKAAIVHADALHMDIDYRIGTVEGLITADEPKFDIVLTLEVVEHVADPARFLADCAALVKPGGLLIMATLNRTAKAFALAVVGAEHILRWLPAGTHDWNKFVTPEEARSALTGAGLDVQPPVGVSFSPLTGRWSLGNDTAVNYMLVATKPKA